MRIGPASPVVRPAATQAAGTPASVSTAAPAAKPGLGDRLRHGLSGTATFVRHMFQPFGTWTNPQAPTPTATGGLKVMSYNVMVKTTRFEQVAKDLETYQPDVVGLQETSEATARKLAERLGMHLVWQEDPFHAYGGTAILSRYPVKSAEKLDLVGSFGDRARHFWDSLRGGQPRMAAMDKRFGVLATIQVGDRTVDLMTAHLTLFGSDINAQQIAQMDAIAQSREAKGHTVVMTGDWNTNAALAGTHPADAKGRLDTPTDTAAEARDRFSFGLGNVGDAADKAALDRLAGRMNNFWDAPSRTVLVEGTLMTPEQALAELQSGKVDPKSARFRQLRDAADGATLLGAGRRFDNIFTSKDARIESAFIDQTTHGSDHQPALAEVRWD